MANDATCTWEVLRQEIFLVLVTRKHLTPRGSHGGSPPHFLALAALTCFPGDEGRADRLRCSLAVWIRQPSPLPAFNGHLSLFILCFSTCPRLTHTLQHLVCLKTSLIGFRF